MKINKKIVISSLIIIVIPYAGIAATVKFRKEIWKGLKSIPKKYREKIKKRKGGEMT